MLDKSGKSPQKEAAEWLDLQVKKKAANTLIADLTPALAEVLLERNKDNRRLRQTTVDMYARDMLEGNWQLNGEPIILSERGELNDGQHRCWAVWQSGVTIKTVFVIGMKRETRTTLDGGINRKLSDYIEIGGTAGNATALAAAAAYGFEYVHKNTMHRSAKLRATRSEVLQFIEEFPNLKDSVKLIAPNKIPLSLGGRGLLSFIHWVLARKNKEKAEEFMEGLINGIGLEANNPILYVRNRLMMIDTGLRRGAKAELIFRAWNAWRGGQNVKAIRVLGGAFPDILE